MSSGFVTETELAERRKIRQEEWEKVRTAEQPLGNAKILVCIDRQSYAFRLNLPILFRCARRAVRPPFVVRQTRRTAQEERIRIRRNTQIE